MTSSGWRALSAAVAAIWRATPTSGILGRQVAVRRREDRRPLDVRVVVGAARRQADPVDPQRRKAREQRVGILDVAGCAGPREPERGRVALVAHLGHADVVGARLERHHVEGRQPHADLEAWRVGADAVRDAGQEPQPVVEAAAVLARPGPRAEQFVPEVAVAVLDVDEREPGALCARTAAATKSSTSRSSSSSVKTGRSSEMPTRASSTGWRYATRGAGPAERGLRVPARVRELQADEQVVRRAVSLAMRVDERCLAARRHRRASAR